MPSITANIPMATYEERSSSVGQRSIYSGRAPGKHFQFISEPINDEPLTILPGVGPFHAKILRDNGFYLAKDVLNKFLSLGTSHKEQRRKCEKWLKNVGFYAGWERECSYFLSEYCREHRLNSSVDSNRQSYDVARSVRSIQDEIKELTRQKQEINDEIERLGRVLEDRED